MKKYRFVIDSVFKYKWYLLLLILLYSLAMSLSLVMPKIQGKLIDSLTEKSITGLNKYIKYLIVLFMFSVVTSFLGEVVSWLYSKKISQDLMLKLLKTLLKKKMTFYSKYNAGYMLQRVYEVFNLEPFFGTSFISVLMTLFSFGGAFYFVWKISKILTLVCIALYPIYFVSMLIYTKPIKSEEIIQQETVSILSSKFVSYYESIFTFKTFCKTEFFLKKIKSTIVNYYNSYFKLSFLRAQHSTFSTISSRIAPILVLVIGGRYVIKGEMTVGNLFEVLGYIPFLFQPFERFTSFYAILLKAKVSLTRINDIMSKEQEENDMFRDEFVNSIDSIEYKNVSFSYNENINLIKEINFKVKRGDRFAIVGDSGKGKTTLLNLLIESIRPTSGKILINGKDYLILKKRHKNEKILYLPSKPQLFEGSILDNISLGDEFNLSDVNNVLKKVKLFEKVYTLPQKLHTHINDENNLNFSEGEKQKIQLARVLLRNCDVLIADETTNNLDMKNEKEIFEIIKKEFEKKILIVVSHNMKDYFGINKHVYINPKNASTCVL